VRRLIAAWADFVVAKRALVIAIAIGMLPLVLFTGGSIPFDNSTARYFIDGDPALQDYDQLLELFGDNEYLIVGLEAEADTDIFSAEALEALVTLSDFLDFHPSVTQLRSLSNYQYLSGNEFSLSSDYLIDDPLSLAGDSAEIERIKNVLLGESLALNTLVTEDFKHTRIAARVEYREETSEHKVELVQALFELIATENLNSSSAYTLHLSGYPLVNERFETVTAEDTAILIPIMVVVMISILYLSFRSLAAMVLPWLVIAAGVLLLLEIQYYLGIPHTTIDNSALIPTLIIIGIGITVHVLLHFFQCAATGKSSPDAARETVEHIWIPAFFTAITTSAGFLALSVTRILPIREFALLGAIGPILLFLFSLTVLPAMLSYLGALSDGTKRVVSSGLISRTTQKVPDFTFRNRKAILIAAALITAFTAWNLPNAEVDNNYVTLFKKSSMTRQDIVYFDDVFKGMMTLDIILDSGEAEGIKDPEFLQTMDTIQQWLSSHDRLGKINSLTDYLKEINQALNGDDETFYQLPDSREMSAQFLLLYDSAGANEDLSDIKDFENRYARMVVPVVNLPASEMQEELNDIRAFMEREAAHLNPVLTGTMALYTVQDIYTAEGMVLSFLVALAVISCFFILLFRSIRYGLLSIIPSVMPILLAASIAGFMGIYLDQSAVIVFAMTMGIAVDDAIHVMNRYLTVKRSGASTEEAIQRAMTESGRAVVFSSMVLVFGFSVLCFGSFTTVINVGLFGSIIMALALLGDLIFLPAILFVMDAAKQEQRDSQTVYTKEAQEN